MNERKAATSDGVRIKLADGCAVPDGPFDWGSADWLNAPRVDLEDCFVLDREDEARYAGLYVAYSRGRVLGAGRTAAEALADCRTRHGAETPADVEAFFVEPDGE